MNMYVFAKVFLEIESSSTFSVSLPLFAQVPEDGLLLL